MTRFEFWQMAFVGVVSMRMHPGSDDTVFEATEVASQVADRSLKAYDRMCLGIGTDSEKVRGE